MACWNDEKRLGAHRPMRTNFRLIQAGISNAMR